jgi:drug/metabolite transporter (DMT)-like permease
MNIVIAVALTVFATFIGAIGALFMKIGSGAFSLNPAKLLKNWRLLLGYFCYFASTFPFLIALKLADVTFIYPFVATSYIWVIILSYVYLKERMNGWKYLGITFILLGVYFIGLGRA